MRLMYNTPPLIAKVSKGLLHLSFYGIYVSYLSIDFTDSFIYFPDSLGTAGGIESTNLVMTKNGIAFQKSVTTFAFGKHFSNLVDRQTTTGRL